MALSVPIWLSAVALGITAATNVHAAFDEQALQTLLVERVDERKWGTAIVVGISSPQGRRIMSYGTLSVEDRRKVDGSTVFEIASLTKVLTALVLADMATRGRLKLDSPVSTCLPDGVNVPQHAGKQITFVDLVTHTSGLPLRPTNLASQTALNKYAGYTAKQLYEGLATFELPRDPGTKFEYSNWAFGLLGQALSHCGGMSYEALLAERVTGPLGMDATMFVPSKALGSRLAAPYDARLRPVPNESLGALGASGGLYSSVNDLLKFIVAVPRPWPAAAHCGRCDHARATTSGRRSATPHGTRLACRDERRQANHLEQRPRRRLSILYGARPAGASCRRRTDEWCD